MQYFPDVLYLASQKRMLNDRVINSTVVEVLQDERWESIPWKKLQVGDVVRVSIINMFPRWEAI